jgi:hypothetical protein
MIGNNSREGADLTAQDQATTEISTSLFVNLARTPIIRMKPPRDSDDFTLAEMQAHRDRW